MRTDIRIRASISYHVPWNAKDNVNVTELKCPTSSTPLTLFLAISIWATSWENLIMPYANNKGADQSAHRRNLISTLVFRFLDSIMPLVSVSEILRLYLVSVAEQAGLCLTWSQTPKTDFLLMRLIHDAHIYLFPSFSNICACRTFRSFPFVHIVFRRVRLHCSSTTRTGCGSGTGQCLTM